MYLRIQKLNSLIIQKAEDFFEDDFKSKLKTKSTYKESLVARYLISKHSWKYSSISHKDNLVFIWVSDEKIAVDIEVYKKRDEILLDRFLDNEYDVLWWKTWDNFYVLWTAKESIVKILWLLLDEIENIKLENVSNTNLVIDKISFIYRMTFKYKSKEIDVLSWVKWKLIYSISYEK